MSGRWISSHFTLTPESRRQKAHLTNGPATYTVAGPTYTPIASAVIETLQRPRTVAFRRKTDVLCGAVQTPANECSAWKSLSGPGADATARAFIDLQKH